MSWKAASVFFILFSTGTWAGSTIYYHPTNGAPLRWETNANGIAEIHYIVDKGGLGRLTHVQALQLLQATIALWEQAANVKFIYDGDTDQAIDGTNYTNYLVVDATVCTDVATPSTVENSLQFNRTSIIAFDNTANSDILDDIDGLADDGSSYGLTNITCIKGTNADPQFITSAQIVFNGATINGTNNDYTDVSVNTFAGIMLHELGHFIGLDHSEANQVLDQAINSGQLSKEDYARYVPTMESTLVIHEDMATLNPDDIAAAQTLYPFSDSPTTILEGTLIDANNIQFRGSQIEMRNLNDPLCEVYSFISGKQCTPLKIVEGGSTTMVGSVCPESESSNRANFFLRSLPSGDYGLAAQETIDTYKGGVIHPFATDDPIPALVGNAEFYNTNDTASEDPFAYTVITVGDNDTITDLNITLSGTTDDGDGEENLIPISFFTPANGFADSTSAAVQATSRCQPNTVDYAKLIGVDDPVANPSPTTGGGTSSGSGTSSSGGGCSLNRE